MARSAIRVRKRDTIIVLAACLLTIDCLASPLGVDGTTGYFTNHNGRVFLNGWHTWNNLQNFSNKAEFDFDAYLDDLATNEMNFVRLWQLDSMNWSWFPLPKGGAGFVDVLPYARSATPGANDGGNKFDLTRYDAAFFNRLSNRVTAAEAKGIFVSVMFFEATTPAAVPTNFVWSPYNMANNVNGALSSVDDMYQLGNAAMTNVYGNYIREVIDTVNGFDNVLYEVMNESLSKSSNFQFWVVDAVHRYEARKPKQHPVGITACYGTTDTQGVLNSNADWWSPTAGGGGTNTLFKTNPPIPTPSTKVCILDTDHLFSITGTDPAWVWKAFTRGYYPIDMEHTERFPQFGGTDLSVRRALRDVGWYAKTVKFDSMNPSTTISSTTYALFSPGSEYLVYQPARSRFTVDILAGDYICEWYIPSADRKLVEAITATASGKRAFKPPSGYSGGCVLYLRAVPPARPLNGKMPRRSEGLPVSTGGDSCSPELELAFDRNER